MSNDTKLHNSKEEFCGACLTVPIAIAGAGAASYGVKGRGEHKKMKKIMLWSGLTITLLSIILAIYFLFRCKQCRQ